MQLYKPYMKTYTKRHNTWQSGPMNKRHNYKYTINVISIKIMCVFMFLSIRTFRINSSKYMFLTNVAFTFDGLFLEQKVWKVFKNFNFAHWFKTFVGVGFQRISTTIISRSLTNFIFEMVLYLIILFVYTLSLLFFFVFASVYVLWRIVY